MSARPGLCPYLMRPTYDGTWISTVNLHRRRSLRLHRPAASKRCLCLLTHDREWRFRLHNRGVCPTVLDGESITTAAFLRRSLDE
eukprot:scaffold28378_cov223-Skeletonema_marinoi.AAC.2